MDWKQEIDALGRVLAEFPGLEQSKEVEFGDRLAVRLTVQLRHDRRMADSPPEIFLIVTAEECTKVRAGGHGTDGILRARIQEHFFEDANHSGTMIRTSVKRDSEGVWRALCVDRSRWIFDAERQIWERSEMVAA